MNGKCGIEGSSTAWEVMIGLEMGLHTMGKSMPLSGAATTFGAASIMQASFVDSASLKEMPAIKARCDHAN
jgi:aspartyl-tRNA(Asn)/glutamyl-tRNA(Gln) amidotransferase subunit B